MVRNMIRCGCKIIDSPIAAVERDGSTDATIRTSLIAP